VRVKHIIGDLGCKVGEGASYIVKIYGLYTAVLRWIFYVMADNVDKMKIKIGLRCKPLEARYYQMTQI
jgi:hypothetical protein